MRTSYLNFENCQAFLVEKNYVYPNTLPNKHMSSKITTVDREQLQSILNKSKTYGEVLRHFGLENKGGNHYTLKRRIMRDSLKADHIGKFAGGAGWNRGLSGVSLKRISKEDALKTIFVRNYNGGRHPRKYLRYYQLIEEKCDECGLTIVWNGKPLVLELDHRDGDSHNNELSNLRWMCGNCHSQTKTFRGRNKRWWVHGESNPAQTIKSRLLHHKALDPTELPQRR